LPKFYLAPLEAVCRLAGVSADGLTERIASWEPPTVTMETLRSAVTDLTAPTMSEMALARAKTDALTAELASVPKQPRSERWDRDIPLSERSRESIYAEMKAETLNFNTMGCDGSRYKALDQEILRRDIALSGYNYTPALAR
jgi:hypothetical protein